MAGVYYNENDSYAVAWLENLIKAGQIPSGKVCNYDIRYVSSKEVEDYEQCHFFAGIGGWPYALALAGWRGSVWTGSCPCQPYSCAGRGGGADDPRDLWPVWLPLIAKCRPPVLFGEQVASRSALTEWLPRVYADLEEIGYRIPRDEEGNWEAYVLPACSVGAPHIRQRLFWGAEREKQCESATDAESESRGSTGVTEIRQQSTAREPEGRVSANDQNAEGSDRSSTCAHRVADSHGQRFQNTEGRQRQTATAGQPFPSSYATFGGIQRRIPEPSIRLVVDGVSASPLAVRAYGNAIVPQVAAEFITAFIQAKEHTAR